MSHQLLLILDFGSQFTQLIARRARELGVYTEIHPPTLRRGDLDRLLPKGIILSGGPASVTDSGAPGIDPALLAAGVPVLGICYGMQLLAHVLGGTVRQSTQREYGEATLSVDNEGCLFAGVNASSRVWASHGDIVEHLPPGFLRLGHTDSVDLAARRPV